MTLSSIVKFQMVQGKRITKQEENSRVSWIPGSQSVVTFVPNLAHCRIKNVARFPPPSRPPPSSLLAVHPLYATCSGDNRYYGICERHKERP